MKRENSCYNCSHQQVCKMLSEVERVKLEMEKYKLESKITFTELARECGHYELGHYKRINEVK